MKAAFKNQKEYLNQISQKREINHKDRAENISNVKPLKIVNNNGNKKTTNPINEQDVQHTEGVVMNTINRLREAIVRKHNYFSIFKSCFLTVAGISSFATVFYGIWGGIIGGIIGFFSGLFIEIGLLHK